MAIGGKDDKEAAAYPLAPSSSVALSNKRSCRSGWSFSNHR
jgi:hypothetical protein